MIRWSDIDLVFLDLDGTLLDLAYDNYIWLARVPEIYAEREGLSIAEAGARLAPRFRAHMGTLNWYSLEFWSDELGIDLVALHRAESHRIAWLPGARRFLEQMRERGKALVLLTNSHPITLEIKDAAAGIAGFFDAMYSSARLGAPKESDLFWPNLQQQWPYRPERCFFADDSLPVLEAARRAGIAQTVQISRPDSSRASNPAAHFKASERLVDLLD
ncbi:MAG: HAD-IA family hydrolase [Steroidobacteraceae bacterium]